VRRLLLPRRGVVIVSTIEVGGCQFSLRTSALFIGRRSVPGVVSHESVFLLRGIQLKLLLLGRRDQEDRNSGKGSGSSGSRAASIDRFRLWIAGRQESASVFLPYKESAGKRRWQVNQRVSDVCR